MWTQQTLVQFKNWFNYSIFFAIYINSNSLDTFLEWQLNFCYWINLRNFHVANTRLYSVLKNARKTIKIYVMKFFIIFSSCCLYSMGLLFMTKELKFKIFTKADDGWVDVKKTFLLCISLQIKSITYSTRVSWFFFWDKLFFFIFRFIDTKKRFLKNILWLKNNLELFFSFYKIHNLASNIFFYSIDFWWVI